MAACFKICFFNSDTNTLSVLIILQLIELSIQVLVKIFISKASDLISLVRNLIEILILSVGLFSFESICDYNATTIINRG